jgi:predicted acyl esterase
MTGLRATRGLSLRLRGSLALAAALVGVVPAVASSAPRRAEAFDYTKVPGLSQPTGAVIETAAIRLPSWDGKQLYVEVTRPVSRGRVPVILSASPYHDKRRGP